MPLICNLDAKGKALRLISGMVMTLLGIGLAIGWAWPTGTWKAWGVTGVVLAFGAFQIFEGWAGWCVVRAMGFKTRI